MKSSQNSSPVRTGEGLEQKGIMLLLGIDTCGPSGSVALGRLAEGVVEILEQIELEGRSYSATLIAAVGDLLAHAGAQLRDLGAIVAVNGPGSFTGVRVGLSAVKGLAESERIPVVALSRLAVQAWKAGCVASALDAHRNEVFLRVPGRDGEGIEMLAGRPELSMIPAPARIAVCDAAAAALLETAWPESILLDVPAPAAADALRLALPRIPAGTFVDLAQLDGHYLRRSDAEIFGEVASGSAAKVRRA
jgi:tRNA threonylcarbamoyladenosine biosynthesis protein TsaB